MSFRGGTAHQWANNSESSEQLQILIKVTLYIVLCTTCKATCIVTSLHCHLICYDIIYSIGNSCLRAWLIRMHVFAKIQTAVPFYRWLHSLRCFCFIRFCLKINVTSTLSLAFMLWSGASLLIKLGLSSTLCNFDDVMYTMLLDEIFFVWPICELSPRSVSV